LKNSTQQIKNDALTWFINLVIQYRWLVIFFAISGSFIAIFGCKNLAFINNHRIYFSPTSPQNIEYEKLQTQFSQDDGFTLAIDLGKKRLFEKESLTYLYEITEESWSIPHSSRVDSLTNFMHSEASEDALEVNALVGNPEELNPLRINKIKNTALNDPLIVGRLLSDDQSMAVLNVSFQFETSNLEALNEAVDATRKLITKYEKKYPWSKIYLAGTSMVGVSFLEAAKSDSMAIIPFMYGIILLILLVAFRSFFGVFVTVLIVFLSAGSALGIVGWFEWGLNATSVNGPTIIMTLAVADTVHFLVGIYRGMQQGLTKHDAIIFSAQSNFSPMFFTTVTTAIGFFSMNAMDIAPVRDFGNITGIGVIIAFILVITLVPAMASIAPLKKKKSLLSDGPAFAGLADFIIKNHIKVFIGSMILLIFIGSNIGRLVVDDVFQKYFSEAIPFRIAADVIDQKIGSTNIIEYRISSGKEGGIKDPAYLQTLEEFTEYAKTLHKVAHVYSIVEIFKKLNRNMNQDRPEFDRLPDSRELAAQFLLLYEMSLPFGRDLTNQINIDKSASRVTISTRGVSTRENIALVEKLDQWLITHTPEATHSTASGLTVVFSKIYNENMDGMISGTLVAFILITFCMFFCLRSFSLGIISMVPNAVPIIMAYGMWYFINGKVGLATCTVAMASIGIVVDDTVHFLSKYILARRTKGYSPAESIRYTLSNVGSALWITSLVLGCGFGILTFSVFTLNAHMGGLVAMTIIFALAADFFLLPSLLLIVDRKTKWGIK
jgi:uncharacterized protein